MASKAKSKRAFYRNISNLTLERIQANLMRDTERLEAELEENVDNLLWIGLELKNRENLRGLIDGKG